MSSTVITDKTKAPAPSQKAAWLKQARQMHLYLGTLFAPAIIFFAFTGFLQIFSLHEGRPGGSYQPPAWIVKLAAIHKKQNLQVKGPPTARPAGQKKSPDADQERRPPQTETPRKPEARQPSVFTYLLKWFFALTSLGLIFTTVLGIYMAFKFNRSRVVIWSLLLAGTLIPAALIAMLA